MSTPPEPQAYPVGAIVNGHIFNGHQWLPVDTPPPPHAVALSTGEHVLHGVLTFFTLGCWAPVWILRTIMVKRRVIQ